MCACVQRSCTGPSPACIFSITKQVMCECQDPPALYLDLCPALASFCRVTTRVRNSTYPLSFHFSLNLLCTSVHILAFFSHWGNCNNLLTGVPCSNFSQSVLNWYLLYTTSNELSLEYKIVESFLFFFKGREKAVDSIFGSMMANEF